MQIVEFYSTMVIRAVPLSESDSSAVSDSLSSALSEASVWILSFCCFWIYSETMEAIVLPLLILPVDSEV